MFKGFAGQWTPVLPLREVAARPRRIRLAGENLVCWRAADRAAVIVDRCPHRGVSLSLGKVTPDGALACGFHGWEFGADGGCVHIPFNPGTKLDRYAATALPVRESAGYLWVFTGERAEGEPEYPDSLDDPSLARFDHHEDWACHWTRAMENMLDFPHLPYVHRTTIGRFVRAKQQRDSRLHLDLEDTPYGFRFSTRVDQHPPGARLRWYRPNGMVLDTIPAPRMMRLHVWCVPVDQCRTRMILTSTRNFVPAVASPALNRFSITVLRQDRAIVESCDPVVVPRANAENSVPTDQPTLRFRSWFWRTLGEHAQRTAPA